MILLSKEEHDFLVIRPNAPVAYLYLPIELPRRKRQVYWATYAPKRLKRFNQFLLTLNEVEVTGGRLLSLIREFNEIEMEQP